MTCIVGIEHDQGVTMGADSFWGNANHIDRIAEDKIKDLTFTTPDGRDWNILFGFSGNPRVMQILEHETKISQDPRSFENNQGFLVKHFVGQFREALKGGGALDEDSYDQTNGYALLAFEGGLYYIGYQFQVTRSQRRYRSIGAGYTWAEGALFSTQGVEEPEERIRAALGAAEEHCPGVCGPFHFYEQTNG